MKALIILATLAICIILSLFIGWTFGFNFDHRDAATGTYSVMCLIITIFATGVVADHIGALKVKP